MAFGKPLSEQGLIQADIARSRIDIESSRLLVLKAAHSLDTHGSKVAMLSVCVCVAWLFNAAPFTLQQYTEHICGFYHATTCNANARSCCGNSVCPSICLSVHLSNTYIVRV